MSMTAHVYDAATTTRGVSAQLRGRDTLIVAADRAQWAKARHAFDLDRVMVVLPGDVLPGHRFKRIIIMAPQTNEGWRYMRAVEAMKSGPGAMVRVQGGSDVTVIDAPVRKVRGR